jgi:hypothetical protein
MYTLYLPVTPEKVTQRLAQALLHVGFTDAEELTLRDDRGEEHRLRALQVSRRRLEKLAGHLSQLGAWE